MLIGLPPEERNSRRSEKPPRFQTRQLNRFNQFKRPKRKSQRRLLRFLLLPKLQLLSPKPRFDDYRFYKFGFHGQDTKVTAVVYPGST